MRLSSLRQPMIPHSGSVAAAAAGAAAETRGIGTVSASPHSVAAAPPIFRLAASRAAAFRYNMVILVPVLLLLAILHWALARLCFSDDSRLRRLLLLALAEALMVLF